MKFINIGLLIFCMALFLACGGTSPNVTVTTNTAQYVNSSVPDKPPEVAEKPVEKPAKPESKHSLTNKGRELIDVQFDVGATTNGKLNLYNITYIAAPTQNVISELTVYTFDNELVCLEVRYTPLKKMVRLMQYPKEGIVLDTPAKKGQKLKDSKSKVCLEASKRIIGIYQTSLKQPPEDQLENLFYDDCGNLPPSWIMPMDDDQDKDFDPSKYKM